MTILLAVLLLLTSIFLILLILIQRGRGGGLAGAFGGMGGQSAFGTKAGDLFTRVTIGVTFFWILLCIVSVKVMGVSANKFGGMGAAAMPDNGAPSDSVPSGSGADNGKLPENVSPGAAPVAGDNGGTAGAGSPPAASVSKTGDVVPAPGTAGDSGAAGSPITGSGAGAAPSGQGKSAK